MKTRTGKSNIDIVKSYVAGEKAFQSVGWTPALKERKEGETWTESDGTNWIYKNGSKKCIGKISPIVGLGKQECKDCNADIRWGSNHDNKMFYKTGRCSDCQVIFETKLRKDGKYDAYEKWKIFNNQKSYCLDMKSKLEESLKFLENKDNVLKYMNEDGTEEKWTDTMREKIMSDAKRDHQECLDTLVRIEEQLKTLNYAE